MTDIVAFLTARLDEDERSLASSFPGPWRVVSDRSRFDRPLGEVEGHGVLIAADGAIIAENVRGNAAAHIARHDPARVLREVAAKRRILARHRLYGSGPTAMCDGCGDSDTGYPRSYRDECPELRDLAAIYDEHPDYDPAWRVE